ncbi:MAG: hypothetical protein NTX86_00140, partial [Candidatus Dependentiae bacterium]|nr:hypothetical protein [Candidatus Dependentiae bacterium]
MKHYKISSYLFLNVLLSVVTVQCGTINFRGNSSFVRVAPGASFVVNQPVSSMGGKLMQDIGGTISGSNITFIDGLLQNDGNSMLLNAVLAPDGVRTGTLTLNGGTRYIKDTRGVINQTVNISGAGARVEGAALLTGPITLQDINTTATFALQNSLGTNIAFTNGAILNLDNTLQFADNFSYIGTGTINFNGHNIELGGGALSLTGTFVLDANLTLNGPVTLVGNTNFNNGDTIQGNGNVLTLAAGATISINNNATVFMTDVMLKGLGTGGGSIVFGNNNSTLILSYTEFDLVGNVTQTQGKITVNGPSTWTTRGSTYTFGGTSLLTVDAVTLWKDQAGAATLGTIAFAAPGNLSLINEGRICQKICGDSIATSTGSLQSQIDACCSSLRTSTGFLQSQVDAANTCCTVLKTSTGFLQSQVDLLLNIDNQLKTSTGFLQSQVDAANNCCTVLKTSTGFLQSQVDNVRSTLRTSTGFLQSQIDVANSTLRTSTGFLQSQIDAANNCCTVLKTSTGFLQSQIDSANSTLRTSTGFLQSSIDACCSSLRTSTGFLQSQIDVANSTLRTSTGFLQSQIDAANNCCTVLKTSTGFLQSQIDSANSTLRTST